MKTNFQIIDEVLKKFFDDNGYSMYSAYWMWSENKITNYGEFQTKIFEAFRIAGGENRKKLADAFPYWFILPSNGVV